jgi:acyl-CoA thioesterase YciA
MDRRVKPSDDGLSPRWGATIKPAAEMGFSMHASNRSDAPQAEPALRAIAMPADANPYGDIFGGWLLSQMDLAGGAVARRHAKGRTVTVAITAMTFHRPVFVGDEVSCYAEIIKVGKTSITVKVESWVRRGIGDEHIAVTEGIFTYVAVGEDRRPRPVPPED